MNIKIMNKYNKKKHDFTKILNNIDICYEWKYNKKRDFPF